MPVSPDVKVAIITGGASGIGLGIAQRLAADGAKVAIFDLNAVAAEDEAAKMRAEGGTFHCCQAVLPDMIKLGWGRIVNISSSSTHGGQPYMAHYVASKSGVIGLTESLALEFDPKGITVNTIPPGFIDTPMSRRAEQEGRFGDTMEHHAHRTPVRRAGLPADIAAACAFLVSDEAGYITGQVIGVNGGRNT